VLGVILLPVFFSTIFFFKKKKKKKKIKSVKPHMDLTGLIVDLYIYYTEMDQKSIGE
jgi:hypothetical protein